MRLFGKGYKELRLQVWKDGYAESVHFVKCPFCGLHFDKPDWHYCVCPMCGGVLWDDRGGY